MRNFVVLCLLSVAALAQTDTGTIAGQITDPLGGVVPNAGVLALNEATGLRTAVTSNTSGSYVINALLPGHYRVSVSAPGFSTAVYTGVELNIQARLELNVALAIGSVSADVVVSGEIAPIEKESSSVGQVIDNKTVLTLPLNSRNYSQLAELAPGVTPNNGSRAKDGFSANGNRTFQNVYLIDGIDNNNYLLGTGSTGSTQAMRPSIDAIQEFKVNTAVYGAEFGRAAGAVTTLSIKSGTNQLHGSAFEFLRNDQLDANDFFANRSGQPRAPLRRNQFGGTLGGPVIRNRSFLFGSYQGTRFANPNTVTTTVPTAAQVVGNFGSTAIYDPLNVVGGVRQQFPNNIIPDTRIDPIARKLFAFYPQPNQPGANLNYSGNVSNAEREDQYIIRANHRLTEKDNVFVRWIRSSDETLPGNLFGNAGHGGNGDGGLPVITTPHAYTFALNETHIFSPVWVNEFRAGYTNNATDVLSPTKEFLGDQFGIRGLPRAPNLTGLPEFLPSGFAALGDRLSSPNPKMSQIRQFVNHVSWVKGNHLVKFGGDVRFTENFASTASNTRGQFTFNGQFTSKTPGSGSGSGLADFLLGQSSSASLSTVLQGDFRNRYYSWFVGDDWKVNPKLTLNLGLRHEIQTPPWEHHNNIANFDLTPGSRTYGTLVTARDGSIFSRTFAHLDLRNFAPRLGFAYSITPKTVLRGSGGLFYGGLGFQESAATGSANLPFAIVVSDVTATTAAVSNVVLAGGFPADLLTSKNAANSTAFSLAPDLHVPRVAQGYFGLERELFSSLVFSIGYVGSGTAHLLGYTDLNQPLPGLGPLAARRPFPNFAGITYASSFAHATYHSLQTKAEKRFSSSLSLLASYTWSHTIDNSTNSEDNGNGPTRGQDPGNNNAEKGSASIDVRHRMVASLLYELPFGIGKAHLRSGFAGALLGNWQIGGIFTASSGPPFSPTVSPNPANSTGPVRPNRLRDGNLARVERTADRWFDPTAFAVPPLLFRACPSFTGTRVEIFSVPQDWSILMRSSHETSGLQRECAWNCEASFSMRPIRCTSAFRT